jgi:hypothetical protein
MTDGREPERIRLVRGNEVLPLDAPDVSWHVDSGALGVFAASGRAGGPSGRRRFLFEVGPGETLFGVGPTTEDHPGIVAVALEECRLSQITGAAPGADAESFAAWCRHWREAVGFPSEEETPGRLPTSTAAFHGELLRHLATRAGGDERCERERFEQAERRSREMTQEAVGELTSVLTPRGGALPPGSELFLAAQAGRARTAARSWPSRPPNASPSRCFRWGSAATRCSTRRHARGLHSMRGSPKGSIRRAICSTGRCRRRRRVASD